MRRNLLLLSLVLMLAGGCASTPPSHFTRPDSAFPAEGLIVQRVLLTIHGRQFALNAYLAQNPANGKRLVIAETFGAVMADVLIKPDGTAVIMKSSRLFPEKYIRKLVVPDVECVFGSKPEENCPVSMLDTNHFIMKHGPLTVDLRIVETKPGAQPASLFNESPVK